MRSVSDSNTLIGLAKGEVFPVLRELYGDPGTASGLGRGGDLGRRAIRGCRGAGRPGRGLAAGSGSGQLGRADEAVLALAAELQGRLLTSDRQLAVEAARLGVPIVDCAEVVLFACLDGLIPSCRAVFDLMQQRDFGIRDSARRTILRLAGEA